MPPHHAMTCNKVQKLEEEAVEPEVLARISQYPTDAVKKGEEFVKLRFPPNHDQPVSIAYSHQIFPDGLHCGFKHVSVNLSFNETWSCIASEEVLQEEEKNDGSALAILKAKLPQLFVLPTSFVDTFGERVKTLCNDEFTMYWEIQPQQALFERCHAMATFYIECASQVEDFNSNWRMLTLVSNNNNNLLCAFCTVYEFCNPIRNSKSWRICVVLVLPQHQNRGLAAALIQTVYELAARENVTEITVEDPCLPFTRVRRRVEYTMAADKLPLYTLQDFETAPSSIVSKLATEMRFSKPSAQFCFEASWRKLLVDSGCPEQAMRTFRLRVKSRLKREVINLPDSKAYPEEFKQALQEEYLLVEQALDRAIKT